ncbi:DUF1707 SHOCT-like domain-containing protein [Streptomyces fagopyri]|uniref:DUF1707 SHOCT-like domain-containing protein n=1 Tax=Streptomyces fagopyri TaxID=2662397 RepID=UPI0033E73EAE
MSGSEEHRPGTPVLASNAERDRIEARLQHHYAVGRLTLPELEERVAVADGARTREQLGTLVADLPDDTAVRGRPAEVIDSRLLIILLCCSPPAGRSSTGSCPDARHGEGAHGRVPWKAATRRDPRKGPARIAPSGGRSP